MIKLEVQDNDLHHFTIEADEPVTIVVTHQPPVVEVFRGLDADPDDDEVTPVGCYDGHQLRNDGWVVVTGNTATEES